jgi:hypothetical protein
MDIVAAPAAVAMRKSRRLRWNALVSHVVLFMLLPPVGLGGALPQPTNPFIGGAMRCVHMLIYTRKEEGTIKDEPRFSRSNQGVLLFA